MNLPVKGRISCVFGYGVHPKTGLPRFHNGIDIACVIGTPIIAPANGIAVIVDTIIDTPGGKQLIILHDDGTKTGYAHLSEILVKESQRVKTGDIIANAGDTAFGKYASTGAHLHFTYTLENGEKADPLKYFK